MGGSVPEETAEEIPEGVRLIVEERYATSVWKVFVCAEEDGDKCSVSMGPVAHQCAAGERHRRDPKAREPVSVWIEVVPRKIKKKG